MTLHIQAYVDKTARMSDMERGEADREKDGVFSGLMAINPATGAEIPVWISDFVLLSYGTGAIMSVPAHDERDYAFARKFGLPVVPVVMPPEPWDFTRRPTPAKMARMINSGMINGLNPPEAIRAHDRMAGGKPSRRGGRLLPPARLDLQPPALLGRADPDGQLPGVRLGARA